MDLLGVRLRRGLPRVRGGVAWPPPDASAGVGKDAVPADPLRRLAASSSASAPAGAALDDRAATTLRRGLPRTVGGSPWPPPDVVRSGPPQMVAAATTSEEPASEIAEELRVADDSVGAGPTGQTEALSPLPFTRTAWPGVARRTSPPAPAPLTAPRTAQRFTIWQWMVIAVFAGAALTIAAAMAVALVRWLFSLEPLQHFLALYPGEYHLPEGAPIGVPAWLAWQHFFNFFLMVLIIRSGLQVRTEKRPPAYWSPRGGSGKISLTVWFHQSLDILWLLNGAVFVVLLFSTGQWMRVVPTSWEVFPNALSAALQYVSLDWPTENGWVNYNSLQQLAYFATIFVAAPLAALTGFRMSGMWPRRAAALNRLYPIEWARAVHFPVMLYFVAFIAVHVILVLATGVLRNLNHMYAAQGSTDSTALAANWTGFALFVLSLAVVAAAWVAARPSVLSPIARLFGTVSSR